MGKRMLFVLFVVFAMGSVGATVDVGQATQDVGESNQLDQDNETLVENFTSAYGTEITARLNTNSDVLTVELYNPTNETKSSAGIVFHIYDRRINQTTVDLRPGERRTLRWRINELLKIGREVHSVSVYSWGENASVTFNFTKEIGTDNPDRYPVPKIVDAELVTSTSNNRTGHFLAITVKNEGRTTYPVYAYLHTNQTSGEHAPAFVPYGQDRETIYLDLQEDPGDRVMGEVRLYRGSVENASGIRDQIYFEGSLEGGVEIRNESFEPITPPYEENSYRFTPDGADASDGGSLGEDVVVATALAFGVVVVVSLVIGFLFRLR